MRETLMPNSVHCKDREMASPVCCAFFVPLLFLPFYKLGRFQHKAHSYTSALIMSWTEKRCLAGVTRSKNGGGLLIPSRPSLAFWSVGRRVDTGKPSIPKQARNEGKTSEKSNMQGCALCPLSSACTLAILPQEMLDSDSSGPPAQDQLTAGNRECLSPALAAAPLATIPGEAGLGHSFRHLSHPEAGGQSCLLHRAAPENGSVASAGSPKLT